MPFTKSEITRLRSLQDKKAREAAGLYVVENPKVVAELLAAGHPFSELYTTDAAPWGTPNSGSAPPTLSAGPHAAQSDPAQHAPAAEHRTAAAAVRITTAELARISHLPTPSTVFAIGRITRTELRPGELAAGLTLALDGIQDPGNVGTLLRIADWFGFARVLLSPDCADLFSQKVINASMGSFARIRVVTTALAPALAATAAAAAAPRTPVLGCDLEGDSVYALPRLDNGIVVIGAEGRGLSPAVAATLTGRITIPRLGGAESLNAAVAAGIVCAALRRP